MSVDGVTISTTAVVDDRQVLQAELARVNLLRIRGDLSSSKTLCLSILKRFPESVDAHVMMGDLHAEQGDLAPAAEWYALALDLDRTAPGVQIKLSRIQAALDITNQASRTRALIVTGRKTSPWLYVAVIATALAIGSIAYIAGLKKPAEASSNSKSTISNKIASTEPIVTAPRADFGTTTSPGASKVTIPQIEPGPAPSTPPVNDTKSTTKPAAITVVDDQRLIEQISNRSKFAKHVLSVMADPREKSIILTYNVSNDDHGRYIGAMLADIAMEYDTKALLVTLRGVRNGVLSYIADVPRDKVLAVEEREKKDVQDLDNHSWIDEVLTNEYYKDQFLTKSPL